jgi:hypothetical protein
MKKLIFLFAFTAVFYSLKQQVWAEDTGWRRATKYIDINNSVFGQSWAYRPYVEDYASASFDYYSNSSIDYGAFGIYIPEGKKITGIEVQLTGSANPDNLTINLSWNNGSDYTSTANHTHFSTNYTNSTEYFGGPGDLWGKSNWTASELSNGNFLVRLALPEGSVPGSSDLDFIAVKVYYQSTASPITFLSNGTFVVPEGVTEVSVQAWGAGGKGGKTDGQIIACGGGGGGAYASSIIAVTPGATYTVHVGIGTNYITLNGDADSWFGSTSTLFAKGGQNGSYRLAGDGGSAAESIGDITFSGGNGAYGDNDNVYDDNEQLVDIIALTSGGGGSSAGNDATGLNASSFTGGVAPTGGGNGGNGIQSPESERISSDGIPGSFPGGGGGGAINNSGTGYIGGDGGEGQVIVSWEVNCTDGTIALTSGINEQTVGQNTPISEIFYTIGGGATGVMAEGLPDGVTGIYENGTYTISGTPSALGRFYFEVTTTGAAPCPEATDWGVITVTPPADYCHGSAYIVTTEYNIGGSPVSAEYALGQPDNYLAILDNTDELMALDLTGGGAIRPSGSTITLKAAASINGSDEPAIISVHRSENGTGWYQTGTVSLSESFLSDYTIVLNGNTRYVSITKTNGWSKAAVIDAVTYECATSCAPTLSLGSIGDVCSGGIVPVQYFDAKNILCGSGTESPTEFSIDWTSDDILDWSGDVSGNGNCGDPEGSLYIDMVPKVAGSSIPAGTYTGKLNLKNGECASLNYFITVTILSLPEAPTVEVTNGSLQICGEGFVTLKVTGPSDAIYSWYKDDALQFGGQSHTFDFFAPDNVPGTYTYQVTQQLPGECESAKASVSITVRALPTVSVIPSLSEITEGTPVTLTASGAESYSWSSVPAGLISNNPVVSVSPVKNTTYTVTGTTNNCSSTASATIYVRETCKNSADQYEPNNSMSGNLFAIPLDLTIGANLLNAKDPDWYKFDVSSVAKYTIKLTKSGTVTPSVELYGSNGRKLKSVDRTQTNSYNLSIGTYYIKVSAGTKTYLCYTLQVVNEGTTVGALASFDETKSAKIIEPTPDGIFRIWPNPTKNEFQLYNGNENPVKIRVMDVIGRTIEQIEFVGINETVSFGSQYKSGIYFVETRVNGVQNVFKLVKQ